MKRVLFILLQLIIAGIFVGLGISLFQYLTELLVGLGSYLANTSIMSFIILIFVGILVYGLLYYINSKSKGYYGSGIPQLEAYYEGSFRLNPLKMLILIFINSLFSFFVGLPLGGEGPAISISSSIGLIINKLFRGNDDNLGRACGSAGFACAFSNPLAGLCHLIEENRNSLSLSLIIKGVVILAIAFIINSLLIKESLLPYFNLEAIPISCYLYLLIVIALVLLFSKAYSITILWIKSLPKYNRLAFYITPLLIILFILLRRFMPILTGSGIALLSPSTMDYLLLAILGYLIFRVITTAISVASNVSGGIVLPMLCMGGLVGILSCKLIARFDSSILEYSNTFMLVGMFSFLAVLTRAPLTALALGLSTGSIGALALPLIFTIGISFLLSHLLKYSGIYHDLKRLFLDSINDNPILNISSDNRFKED